MKQKHVLPLALTLLVLIYAWAIFNRGIGLIQSGNAGGIALGVAVFVIPALVILFLALEWRLALLVDQMGKELERRDDLPLADIPASVTGSQLEARIRQVFRGLRADIEKDPDNWRTWYHAAFAYNAMGDRRNARTSLREAAKRWITYKKAGRVTDSAPDKPTNDA